MRIVLIAILLLLSAGVTTPALAIGLSKVIGTLEDPFKPSTDPAERIYDYDAEFFQESRIASLDRLQRARGTVIVAFDYQRADTVPLVRFRWEYAQPTNQEIVSDGETLWVYLPENRQVIQSDIEMVNQARQNDPMTFLTGLGNLSRDFMITWAQPNRDVEGNYVLELTPRKVSSLLNRLIIVVDRRAVEAAQGETQPANPAQPPLHTSPRLPADFPFAQFDQPADGVWFPILSTTVYDPNGNSTIIEFSNVQVNRGVSPLTFDFVKPAGVQVVRPTGQEMGF